MTPSPEALREALQVLRNLNSYYGVPGKDTDEDIEAVALALDKARAEGFVAGAESVSKWPQVGPLIARHGGGG